jgi:hypothetical protein
MRTLRQLEQYFDKHQIKVDRNDEMFNFSVNSYMQAYKDYYGKERIKTCADYNFTMHIDPATFCCGVHELGNYEIYSLINKVDWDMVPAHIQAGIEYIIQKEGLRYLRTETITERSSLKQMTAIETALEKIGFRLVTKIPSAHGRREGKSYKIKVWDWIKK